MADVDGTKVPATQETFNNDKIGWIGLGKCGLPIAEHIAKTCDVVAHDIIEKEGGKKTGVIKITKIKKGENLNKFLLRVGFTRNHSEKIIQTIKSHPKSNNMLRKIPVNHYLKFSLPNKLLGGSLEFKFNKNKTFYVWQNFKDEFISKIMKLFEKESMSFHPNIL